MTAFSADDLFQHADALHRLARDLVADPALADDAVQQAYLTALRRPPRQRVADGGWLRAVVRSCSLDLLRAEGRRRRREQAAAPVPAPAADQTAERLELQEAIATAVRGLGEPYSTTVWLRYYEGLSPTEIAARQGDPVKTVKTRLGRALQMLRSKLDGRPGGRERWLPAMLPLARLPLATAGSEAAVVGGGGLLFAKWLGGLVAAGLALAVSLSWWGGAPAGNAALTADAGSVPALEAARAARGSGADNRAQVATDQTPVQRDLAPQGAASALEPSVQVRVVDANGNAVPNVDVLYAEPQQAAAAAVELDEPVRRLLQWDSVGWLRRLGQRATTDALGIARWPWLASEGRRTFWWCVVQHGDQYGELWVSKAAPASDVHELRLQTDVECLVRVLDAQGGPVPDVRVAATFARREEPAETGHEEFGPTDAEGRVRMRHVQTWRGRVAPRSEVLPATLRIDLPGIDVAREIDVHALTTEPVLLYLPPWGSFEIEVRDAFSLPVAGERLHLREDGGAQERSYHADTDAAGIARFPWVGLGRSWRLDRQQVPPATAQQVVGPRTAREVVRVLRQPDPAPVLTGRLLRDGAPAANTSLSVTTPGRDLARGRLATDADGRFRIAVAPGWCDQRLTELRLHALSTANGYEGVCATWRGDLVLAVGSHELGTLTLAPEPIVASGQLELPAGELVPADLRLTVQVATGDAAEPWHWLSLSMRCQPDGRFALFGTAPNAALRLVVTTENRFVPVPPLPFVAGARDLRIALRRGGSVRASVLADTQLAAFCQVALLVPMDTPLDLPGFGLLNPGIDPRMPRDSSIVGSEPLETAHDWVAVAPGRYRLEIWGRGLHRPLLTVPDVVVVDGQRNEDPRLQKLVVTGLRTIDLRLPQVALAHALPPSIGVGVIAVLDGQRPGEVCWQIDDERAFFATVQPLDLLVRLHGFRDRILRGLVAGQTIELQPGIPATLRVEDFTVPTGHSLRLELEARDDVLATAKPQLYSAAAGGSVPGYRSMVMGAEAVAGAVALRLPAPGRHLVRAILRAADGTSTALVVEPVELSIGEAGGTFPLQLAGPR